MFTLKRYIYLHFFKFSIIKNILFYGHHFIID